MPLESLGFEADVMPTLRAYNKQAEGSERFASAWVCAILRVTQHTLDAVKRRQDISP